MCEQIKKPEIIDIFTGRMKTGAKKKFSSLQELTAKDLKNALLQEANS